MSGVRNPRLAGSYPKGRGLPLIVLCAMLPLQPGLAGLPECDGPAAIHLGSGDAELGGVLATIGEKLQRLDLRGDLTPRVAERLRDPHALLPTAIPRATPARGDGGTPWSGSPPDEAVAILSAAHRHLEAAFAALDPAFRARLSGSLPKLLSLLQAGPWENDDELSDTLERGGRGFDRAAMYRAVEELRRLLAPAFLRRLEDWAGTRASIENPAWLNGTVDGALLAAISTPWGAVLIGSRDDNTYRGPAAVIIDPGGDDVYDQQPGAVGLVYANGEIRSLRPDIGVLLDLAGNDRYLASGPVAQGGAFMGIGLLVDLGGDDLYAASEISQGAGIFGFGLLLDGAGNDRYLGTELSQGAALFGEGLLLDMAGDDTYRATRYSQGFGGPGGRGRLWEIDGDDYFRAGGRAPSSYGLEGRFQAFSQGVGMGLRPGFPGGEGVLADLAGDDRYLGDNFSQGVGYHLGFGYLLDVAGDDHYVGGRYSQGAAAHLGVGLLLDRAGNDHYRGELAANQGGAWDLALAALVDLSGNDVYRAGDLSLGSAAQNGIAWFVDLSGDDDYLAVGHAFGHSGALTYEAGRGAGNFTRFRDCGGEDGFPDSLRPRVATPPTVPEISPKRTAGEIR